MRIIKKWIPQWIKNPIAVFISDVKRMPWQLIGCHVCRGIVESRECSEDIQEKVYTKVKRKTYNYLFKKYSGFINDLTAYQFQGVKQSNYTIWIFWWQGENSAPEIVRRCIRSIRKNSGGYSVQIIDSQNYSTFINVPEHILYKFYNNTISLTHFSDYYRMALLFKYGGLWIDASIFVTKEIDKSIFDYPLFTVRNPGEDMVNISDWDWTVGVIGGWKGNTIFYVVQELLNRYWEEYDFLLDYFLFDYMIKLVFENCSMIKEQIMQITPNNEKFYFWQQNANSPFDEELYNKELNSSTWLYKLSWKGNYALKTEEGEDTFYFKWLQDSEL